MKKQLIIMIKSEPKKLITQLNKNIQSPNINFLDIGLKKRYSGRIMDNKFWFTWSQTMSFTIASPIVKGQISENQKGTKIEIRIEDNTYLALLIFVFVFLIPTIFFLIAAVKTKNYMGLGIIAGILSLLFIILLFNLWRVKRGMIKMEKEVKELFNF